MIKQLLSSAGSNKEAGLATNITRSANDKSESNTPGLFGSILKTVQGFGQQEESQNTSNEESKQAEEAVTLDEKSASKTVPSEEEKAVTQENEKGELEITGAEKVVQEQKAAVAEGLTQADVESSDFSEEKNETKGEATVKVEQAPEDLTSKDHKATEVSGESNAEKGIGDTAQAIHNKDAEPESADPKISYEVISANKNITETDALSDEISETAKSDIEGIKKGASAEHVDPKSEQKNQSQNVEIKIEGSSSISDRAAATINADGKSSMSQRMSQKVVDQVSQQADQPKQVAEDLETKVAESEKVSAENAVRMAAEKTVEGAPEVTQGIQNQKAEEVREKRFREKYSFSGRQELTSERLEIITQSRDAKAAVSFLSQFDAPVQFLQNQANTNSATTMTTEQELMLKEHLKESVEVTEQKDASNAMFARLGEVPVSNMLIRRTVMPSLTQAVQKSISAGKSTPETWQKHSFELEDGNSIQLSTRQVDGVLQVKLATTSVELSRLMQQYEQEIKQHLEQECQLDVNLQFDGGEQGQEMSGFFGNPSSAKNPSKTGNGGSGNDQFSSTSTDKNLQQSVRRFGYNQMEWTA